MALNPQSTKLVTMAPLMTDVSLLTIMLVGLVRLRSHRASAFGLGRLLWKQVWFSTIIISLNSHAFPVCEGVVWLLLATVAEVTPVVSPLKFLMPPLFAHH